MNQSHTTNEPHGVNTFTDRYKVYELTEASTDSRVTVVPERGGIVTGFRAFGHDLLYLDPVTVYDPNANIRGGIPILRLGGMDFDKSGLQKPLLLCYDGKS